MGTCLSSHTCPSQPSFMAVNNVPISVIRPDNGASWSPHKQTRLSPKNSANNVGRQPSGRRSDIRPKVFLRSCTVRHVSPHPPSIVLPQSLLWENPYVSPPIPANPQCHGCQHRSVRVGVLRGRLISHHA